MSLELRLLLLCALGSAWLLSGFAAGAHQDSSPPVGEASLEARRKLVALALEDPAGSSYEFVVAQLSDSDRLVRGDAARLLGELELEGRAAAARLGVLERLAREDAALSVRRSALEGLAARRDRSAAEILARLSIELTPDERSAAALHLVSFARGRELAFERLREAFRELDSVRRVPPAVLAVWFSTYGRSLAELEDGGDRASDRAPFVVGDSHASPVVRGAAQRALDTCLMRLRELDRHERADRLLSHLATDGMPPRGVLFLRVRAGLAEGGVDPEVALAGARQLGRTRGGPDEWTDQRWRFRALYLEGMALLALDRAEQAQAVFVHAGDLLDGLLERRVDEAGARGAEEQRDLLHERALVDFARVAGRIAKGSKPDNLALLEMLRRAHQLQLEAQLVATQGDAATLGGLSTLFDSALSPYRLLFAARPHAAWPPTRCLALEADLGRCLASVSAREMPGFEPFPAAPAALSDPVQDPRRSALLNEIARAEIGRLERAIARVSARRLESSEDDAVLENEEFFLIMAKQRKQRALKDTPLVARFYDLRLPDASALRLADRLRREGEHERSREYAQRLAAAMDADQLRAQYPWAVHLAAQAHMAIGGSWTDEDQPERAQEEMLVGLELLEGLRTHYADRGAPQAARAVEGDIADALVSLAVNANVKARDSERALEFFERAYELQQDDFMSILLACYRARSGRADEARELLADIPESPRGYYNLACTYAMLGESERALDLLERDFQENRRSSAALEKQKAWARQDPDLEQLHGDPRFEFLTEPAQ